MQIKYLALLVVSAFAQSDETTSAPISETVFKSQPGVCNAGGTECKKFGTEYECVAVQSSAAGLSNLAQCVKKVSQDGSRVCVGNSAGVCPTFGAWPLKFRNVQPICAFVPDPKCTQATTANGQVVAARMLQEATTTTKAPVTCYRQEVPLTNGSVALVNGIYKCIDRDLYRTKNYGLEYTEKQIKACQGNTTNGFSNGLCNGHGTCAPTSAFSTQYACKCNQGYDPKDNCNVPVGNVCDGLGQCGALGQCDPKDGKCICKPGSKGNQCADCDITSEAACSGPSNGKCGPDAKCVCATGWGGPQCETKSVTEPPPKTTAAPDVTPAPSSAVATGLSVSALVIAALFA
ncbi:hypothetical protein H310_13421 [Aphanomyces invadans]|uniref:EGF-like domain-containing protein n=1 Tax=Aphanomyces invadans TaxID=157072 RepID=A0A024TDT5_9STRA|nr:hypothetical protein H310_13421 [Aphanomyces invadans]ETV92174.1 hypothetical protein H310_13421 [Aphanomyces invadans]|eukprot:XP_008879138.1 hypothetical protein H310_13421 [Aphanomyces invadans]